MKLRLSLINLSDDEMETGIQSIVWLALTENDSERACIFPVTPKI